MTPPDEWPHHFIHTLEEIPANWYIDKELHRVLELLHTHLGFIFPKVFPFLLVIIIHYLVSSILGENICFQLTLPFD
jgi:hypothetical protein